MGEEKEREFGMYLDRVIKLAQEMTEGLARVLATTVGESGKLKGNLELLAKDIAALEKMLVDHVSEEDGYLRDLKAEVRKIQDDVKQLTTVLEASPFSKIVDTISKNKDHLDVEVKAVRDALTMIEKYMEEHRKFKERDEKVYAWVESQKEVSIEAVKGGWALRVAIVSGIFSLIAIIATVLAKTVFK